MPRILIDANIWLDFYRTKKPMRKLLSAIERIADDIFISEQIRNEVVRNRGTVAADFLASDLRGSSVKILALPELLTKSAVDAMAAPELEKRIKDFSSLGDGILKELQKIACKAVEEVVDGKDEISVRLATIFAQASAATPEQTERARVRRERGDPPGKKSDPLGDQLTWEQFRAHADAADAIWLISRDGDYFVQFSSGAEGIVLLNPLLRSDFTNKDILVYCFTELSAALKHYDENVSGYHRGNLSLPPADELEEIEKEERALARPTTNCKCLEGPTPTGPMYNGNRVVILCQKCHRLLVAWPLDDD